MLLAIAIAWLFLLVLALAILRTAGRAERDAEERLRREPGYRKVEEERERRRRSVPTAVVLVALPLAGSAAIAADADAHGCHGARGAPGADAGSLTLCVINAERRDHGLSAVTASGRLARAAQRHARDMVARGYFSHVSLGGSSFTDRLRRVDYARGCSWWAGEALAWGTGSLASPASRVAAWLRSPPHRAILLDPVYREVGIGVAQGSPSDRESGATYAGEFGRRRC